jgi:hypothetical protein
MFWQDDDEDTNDAPHHTNVDHLMTVDDENESALLLKQRPLTQHGEVSICFIFMCF